MTLHSGGLQSARIYMIGIKGTGMAALAELLCREGALVSGSDVEQEFFTDAILQKNGIAFHRGFDAAQVPADADAIIYSSAYDPTSHPELLRARELGFEPLEYSAALSQYALSMPMAGISGIHGKTTTTAMFGTIVRALNLPGSVLVGSAVSNFDGSPTWSGGTEFFVAETCEYRRHFLDFSPAIIVITSIEADHLDYFLDLEDVKNAFRQYMAKLPYGGRVIYCNDDDGARRTVEDFANQRPDLIMIPYGFSASGDFHLNFQGIESGAQRFTLDGFSGGFLLPYPGRHSLLNAAGTLALLCSVLDKTAAEIEIIHGPDIRQALAGFNGTTRRSELIAEIGGVRIMDDYAHHPTAIRLTLEGYRELFPGRRLVVDFMSHTYSRTQALLPDFARAFSCADLLIVNDIYASAREHNASGISGQDLFRAVQAHHSAVHYKADFSEAADFIAGELKSGDVFITMGAGNNNIIGSMVLRKLERISTAGGTC